MSPDLDGCTRGDAQAWAGFVEHFTGLIQAAVSRTLRAHGQKVDERADDIAQDVFVRLVQRDYRLLKSFDPQKASLSTWLTIVARSVTIDHLRKRRPKMAALDGSGPDPIAPPQPNPEPDGIAEHIPPDLLTPRQQLVLELLLERELSVTEAAKVLGVDAQTVRSTKHKAIERLRQHYGVKG